MLQRRLVLQAAFSSTFGLALLQGLHSAGARAVPLHIAAGEAEWLAILETIHTEMNHRQGLDIVQSVGAGSMQTLADLAKPGVADAAILPADVLAYAEAQGLLAPARSRYSLVARLATLPIVLVAHRSIKSLTALANKRTCTGHALSAGFATGELVFSALGIPFVRLPVSGGDAVAAMRRGDADAALLLGTNALKNAAGLGDFHILPLPLPQGLENVYGTHPLDETDLPGLPANAARLETIATDLVLATYGNDERSPGSAGLKPFIADLYAGSSQVPWMAKALLGAEVKGWARNPLAAAAIAASKT